MDTSINRPLPLPAVAIAGHRPMQGVTNVVLDHQHAARLTLSHLAELGHTDRFPRVSIVESMDCMVLLRPVELAALTGN